jgi:hypothetical protein
MSGLVTAFGGDVASLPAFPSLNNPQAVTEYMIAVESECNKNKKEIEVTVTGGWVSTIPGADAPLGYFYYEVINVGPNNSDGHPEPLKSEKGFGDFFFVTYKIIAGEGGQVTPWRGTEFTDLVGYALKVVVVDGTPRVQWELKQDGTYTAAATRLNNLFTAAGPSMFEAPIDNPYNLLPAFFDAVKKDKKAIKGIRSLNTKSRRVLDLMTVQGAHDRNIQIAETSTPPQEIHKEENRKALTILTSLLDVLAGAPTFKQGTFSLTEQGKEVAGQYLTPLREQGVLKVGSFQEMVYDDIVTIFNNLNTTKISNAQKSAFTNLKDQLTAIGVGVDEAPF